jgi:hypothetical protein
MLTNARKLPAVRSGVVSTEVVGMGLVQRAGMSWVVPVGSWMVR